MEIEAMKFRESGEELEGMKCRVGDRGGVKCRGEDREGEVQGWR